MRGSGEYTKNLLFTEEIQVIGRVPLCKSFILNYLEFYIPDCEEKLPFKALVEQYGGRLTDFHECFTY